MSEWYEGLPADELEGKHVHAVYDYGTVVDGELCRNGSVRLDHRAEDGAPVFVVDDGRVVNTFAHILSVSLVWDERDWEQIRTVDMSKADAIVVNGRLLQVTRVMRDVFLVGECDLVPVSFVSSALRCKAKLPTELGAYRGADGTLMIHYKSMMGDYRWRCISRDFSKERVYADDEASKRYLPLTPVHFVDGRAE